MKISTMPSRAGVLWSAVCSVVFLFGLSTGVACAAGSASGHNDSSSADGQPQASSSSKDHEHKSTELESVQVTANYVASSSITANKTSAPLIETPQSVSVVTRDQLDMLNLTDVQQAIRYTAGVVGENYGPDLRYDFMTMRGFTPTEYIDGLQAPITTTIPNVGLDLYGFQEVDVLEGPSAALYGSSPPGGIYNLVSRRASDVFDAQAGALYGTFGYKELHGTVTGPLSDDFSGRATLMYRDQGNQVHGVYGKRLYFAPTFTWQMGERTSLTGLAYYQKDANKGATNGFLPAHGTLLGNPHGKIKRGTNLGEPDYNTYDRHQSGIGWDFKHGFNDDIRFESNAKWYNYKELQHVVYAAGLQPDMQTANRTNFPFGEKVRGFAMDNRFTFHVEGGQTDQTILAGYNYRNLKNEAHYGLSSAPPIDAFHPVYGAPITTPPMDFVFNDERLMQQGLYVQDEIKVHRHLVFTLTGREDQARIHNEQNGVVTKQHHFSYRAGVNYVFDSGWAPYVSHATSFQPTLGTDADTGKSFDPSTSKQTEVGVKYDGRNLPSGMDLFATAAVYRITQDNLVAVQPAITPVAGHQVGRVRASGADIQVTAHIHDQWTINASYSYTDTDILRDADGFATGDWLPNMPRQKLTAFVGYTIRSGAARGLGFGVGGRYRSKSAGSLVSAFNPVVLYSKPRTVWDAAVHYDRGHWRFGLSATNLFDKHYVARCDSITNCVYGYARSIKGTATWRY